MAALAIEACSVCCENINSTNRKPVVCKCSFNCCLKCAKRYIMDTSSQEAHCMSCKVVWHNDFLHENFSKSFIMGDYRASKEMAFFEEEKTFLPALQGIAINRLNTEKQMQKIERYRELLRKNEDYEDQLVSDQRKNRKMLVDKINIAQQKITNLGKDQPEKEKRLFMMKCIVSECRGFLDESFVCGLCNTHACKHCHTIKAEAHVCKQDDVATVDELKKTTKPCPKCYVLIYKTDGCDQMFCVKCHTPFSWKTGLVAQGPVHNPHYFEALRAGVIQEARHRVHQGECGPAPDFSHVNHFFQHMQKREKDGIVNASIALKFYMRMIHHREVTLPKCLNRGVTDEDRIKFLINKMDEKKFKQLVFQRKQNALRKRDEQQLVEQYVSIMEEIYRMFVSRSTNMTILELVTQLNELNGITVKSLQKLDDVYDFVGVSGITKMLLGDLY